jgi:hypothetical protein
MNIYVRSLEIVFSFSRGTHCIAIGYISQPAYWARWSESYVAQHDIEI